jgi:threonine aldolase
MLGGALRQSGILAAACRYALEHNVERLAVDHENARLLGEGLSEMPGVELDPDAIETNIVIFSVKDAPTLAARLAPEVDVMALDERRIRAVTHLDVDRPQIERALAAFSALLR